MPGKRTAVWWGLRVALGLGALLAGLDKFFDIVTDWGAYLSPWAERLSPVGPESSMRVMGAIEIALGLLILAGFARVGGDLLAAWLLVFALSVVTTGRFFDVAVGGIAAALAAFTLARLTGFREGVEALAPPEALGHAAVCGLWTDHAHVTAERSRGLHRGSS